MNSLEKRIKRAKKENEKLFCAFLTLGYPNLAFTKKLIRKMDAEGVDIVELGFPFSDPLADGPTIQESSQQALKRDVHVRDAFKLVRELRKENCRVPIVFFTYFNPVLRYGLRKFAEDLSKNGFDGVICPDLPPDESEELEKFLRKKNQSMVYLVAPTTTDERRKMIARKSSGFIYYVSTRGVTGKRRKLDKELKKKVAGLAEMTKKAVLVGFGVSTAGQAKEAAAYADGVIVGSAIVEAIKKHRKSPEAVAKFAAKLAKAAKAAESK